MNKYTKYILIPTLIFLGYFLLPGGFFLKGNEKPEKTYSQRNGKYMKQIGVTLPKV